MKKNYLLIFLLALIGWSSGAWAQLPFQFKSWNQGDSRWKIYASNPAYYKSQEVEFTSTGDLTVKFHYESGGSRFDFYGIDLVDADGTVKKSDYRYQFSGNPNDRSCTLSGVEPGTYTLRYWTSQYFDGKNWLSPGNNNTVGKIQFAYTGTQSSEKSLSEDSWSKLDGFTKAEAQEVPEGVSREIVKKGWGENPYQYYWDDENVQLNAGGYQAHFAYVRGNWGLGLRAVQVLKNGVLISEDRHNGFIGTNQTEDYSINIPETGTYTIRTIVYQHEDGRQTTIYDSDNCNGTVTYTATGMAKEVTYKVWDAASAEAATEADLLGEYTVAEITNNPPSGISQISCLDYVTIHNQSELPALVTEETNVINLYTTATLPFEVGHPYTISLFGKYAYIPSAESTTVGQTKTAYTSTTYENYEWMFFGDWYNGFNIFNYNYGKGIGTANGTADGNNAASFGTAALFEYEKVSDSKWVLKVKGSNPAAYLAHTSSNSSTINFYHDKGNDGTGITLGTIDPEQLEKEEAEAAANNILAMVEQAMDQKNGVDTKKPFTPISANFTAAVTALQNDKSNAEKLQALKNAVENPDNYYQLPNGRYFVHNWYNYDKSGTEAGNQNNMTKNQSTLTSLTSLVGTAGKVAGYWSVWDINYDENTKTYQMVNEGNKYVMTPGSAQDYKNMTCDDGILRYVPNATNTTKYQVGKNSTVQGAVSTLKFKPALSYLDVNFNNMSVENRKGYVTISGSYNTQSKQDCVMFMDQIQAGGSVPYINKQQDHYEPCNADNVVKSGRVSELKEECLWGFFSLDSNEGNEQETALFFDATEGSLVGVVGGVITLDNVSKITVLNNVKVLVESSLQGIAQKTISQEPGVRAGKYKEVLTKIEAARGTEFFQKLKPDSQNPFYVENVCAVRPSLYSRLTASSSDNKWKTVNKEEATGTASQFTVETVSGEGAETVYRLRNKDGKYFTASTGSGSPCQQTEALDQSTTFKLVMVIPGVYEMKQTNNHYLTVTNTSQFCGYNTTEISAMWRFITYNTVKVNSSDPLPHTDFAAPTDGSETETYLPVFTTYSYDLNSRVHVNKCIVPYYITEVGMKKYWKKDGDYTRYETEQNGATPINRMYITMQKAPRVGDYYYMEDNEGYLLVGSSKTRTSTEAGGGEITGITPEDIEMFESSAENVNGYGQSIHTVNKFSPNTSGNILITTNNKNDYFALQYTYDQIGLWQGQPVYGEGLGFYNLKAGNTIGKYKAYIDARIVKDATVKWEGYDPNGQGEKGDWRPSVRDFIEAGDGFGICLADEEGNVTSVIDVDAKGRAVQNAIYDLQGRRVEKAGKGIFIVGGKKVLFQ